MGFGSDRIRRLIFAGLSITAYVALSYGVHSVRDPAPWVRVLLSLTQTIAFVWVFHQLLMAEGLYANVARSVLIALGGNALNVPKMDHPHQNEEFIIARKSMESVVTLRAAGVPG